MSDFEKKHWCCVVVHEKKSSVLCNDTDAVLWWCMKKKSSVLYNDTDAVLWWCMKKKTSVLCNDTDLVSDTEKVTVSDLWWCMEKVIVERLLITLGRDTKKS
jgi:hypothetical protein